MSEPDYYEPEWDGCCYCGRKSCADGTVCDGPPDAPEPPDA
jgi:hypothetical protein